MHPLYPAIKPYKTLEVPVGRPHVLYVEEAGDPVGIPVIVLHSGPGAGDDPHLRRFFNPELFRIINFDQRGCGRSAPHTWLDDNNTQSLLDDINTIRQRCGLDRFLLFGGGWGSLLALLYAQSYPQQITGLLLYQIFLGRQADIDWFYKHGANLVYPDYWQEFCDMVPIKERDDICHYYSVCLQGNNELARMAAAKNWMLWRARASSLQPHSALLESCLEPFFARGHATLESHFINQHFFIKENQVLNNIDKIRHLPTELIHGRYDMVCPLASAWELHHALSASNLSIIRDAGHSYHEAGLADAIVSASIQFSGEGFNAS